MVINKKGVEMEKRTLILQPAFFILILTFALTISACGGGGGGGGGGTTPDITPPTVTSTSPANGATGVAVNTAVSAAFSEAMDTSTINTTTFTLSPSLSGTVTYDSASRIATFKPSGNLSFSTIYTATITTEVKDLGGNSMTSNYNWSFTTGSTPDITPPSVPANLILNPVSSSEVNLSWDASTDNTAVAGYKIYRDSSLLKSVLSNSAQDTGLSPATPYCYSVSAYDASGNESAQSSQVCSSTFWISTVIQDETGYYVGMDPSIAVDSNGKVHINYVGANSTLSYATNTSGSWSWVILHPTDAVRYTSIAVDFNGKIHISYYEWLNKYLKYATNASGVWTFYTVDSSGDAGSYNSIAVDSNGWAHIAYYDSIAKDLKYATNASGSWVTFTVDSTGNVGRSASIALDSNNNPHILYRETLPSLLLVLKYAVYNGSSWSFEYPGGGSLGTGTNFLRLDAGNKAHAAIEGVTYSTNKTGSWVFETINSGTNPSLALDSSGKAHISFYTGTGDIGYATNKSGQWSASIADNQGDVGLFSAIAVDSTGGIHIAYHDATLAALKYATNR